MTEKLTSVPDANPKACVCDHSPQCRAKAAQHLQKLKKDLSNEQKVAIMDLFKTNIAVADMFLVLEEDESLQWAWISNKLLQMGHLALCHILKIWLSPTPKTSGHLQCHLWSCVVTSLYARKVIFF